MSEISTLADAIGNLPATDGSHLNRFTVEDASPEAVMRQVVPELRRISEVLYGGSIVVQSGEARDSAGAILWGATKDLDRLANLVEVARSDTQ